MGFLKKIISPSLLGKYFLILVIIGIVIAGIPYLMKAWGLPEIPTEADNLNQSQLLLGYIMVLISIIANILSIIFRILFFLSLVMFIFKLLKKSQPQQQIRVKSKNEVDLKVSIKKEVYT